MDNPLAGKTVTLNASSEWEEGTEYRVEGPAVDVLGTHPGNAARLFGSLRMINDGIPYDPTDPDLLYGKIGSLGYMVHASEVRE